MLRRRLSNNRTRMVTGEVTGFGKQSVKEYYESELPSVTWDSRGQGIALCPFHDDEKASLSVNAEKGYFNCHSCGAKGNVFEFYKRRHHVTFDQARRDLEKKWRITMPSRVVEKYDYHNESGKMLFQVTRYEPKSFSVRRPDGRGGWINNIQGVKATPYNLPKIVTSEKVWLVEGEKDVKTLAEHGLVATCNPFGAGKWKSEYNEHFRDKIVRIIPDNDAVGRQHALSVAENLHGIASSIKIIDLNGLEEKEDVTDWFEKGGTRKELIEIAQQTAKWKKERHEGITGGLMSIGELYSIPQQKIKWLVEGMLPMGGLSILGAKPKVGKSTLARFLTLCVAHGTPFLGREVKEGGSIYFAPEEIKVGIKQHFKSMGAKKTDDIYIYADTISSDPIDQLRRYIEDTRPVLVIIDTLFRFVKAEDTNNYGQMIQLLDPLLRLARDTDTHIMAVHHGGKGRKGSSDVVDLLLGSIGISGTVDTIIIMKEGRERRRMITTVQRYGDSLEESELIFDKETQTLHIGNNKTEIQEEDCEDDIVKFLKAQNEPLTEAVILDRVVGRKSIKVKALRNLVANKKVTRTGVGGKKDPFKYSYLFYSHNLIDMTGTRKQESQNTRKVFPINDYSCSHKSVKRKRLRENESDTPVPIVRRR